MNTRFALALTALLGAFSSARADFIDTFDAPTPPPGDPFSNYYSIANPNPNPFTRTDWVSAGVSRTLYVKVTSPLPPAGNAVSGVIGFDSASKQTKFTMDSNNASQAFAKLTYDLSGSASDFSGSTGLELAFLTVDPGNAVGGGPAASTPLSIVIETASGDLTLDTSVERSTNPPVSSFSFESFDGSGDLSQVSRVRITMNKGSHIATDLALDSVRTTPIPAPPAVLLVATALPFFALRRRLKKIA